MFALKSFSRFCASGLLSESSIDEAMSSAVPVSVLANISLICAEISSAPCPVTLGASALSFSLL